MHLPPLILPERVMCAGVFSSDLSKLKVVLKDIPGCLRCSSRAPRRHYQGTCLLQFFSASLCDLHCPWFFQVQFLGGPKNGHCQGQRFTPYDVCHRAMVLALWLVLQRKEHPVHVCHHIPVTHQRVLLHGLWSCVCLSLYPQMPSWDPFWPFRSPPHPCFHLIPPSPSRKAYEFYVVDWSWGGHIQKCPFMYHVHV